MSLASLVSVGAGIGASFLGGGSEALGFGAEHKTSIIGELISVDFDCTYNFKENIKAKISDYPVEGGSTITDHIQVGQTSITISGEFTSCTWGLVGAITEDPSALRSLSSFKEAAKSSYGGKARMMKAVTQLKNMVGDQSKLFSLNTPYDRFSDLAIESFDYEISAREVVKFNMSLRAVTVTTLEWGEVVKGSSKKPIANKGGKTKAPVGNKAKAPEKVRDMTKLKSARIPEWATSNRDAEI